MPRKKNGLPTPVDERDNKLLADVKEHGWHVLGVAGDEKGPDFAYSIGLYHTFKHPEVIVFGLDIQKVMHPMINGIGEEIRSGKGFEHLDEAGDVLEGYNVQFRKVDRKHYRDHLGYARWFYQGDDFPVLQVFWPDKNHRYPWYPGFNTSLVHRQPILSEDRTWPFHEGKNLASITTRPVIEDDHPILLVSHDSDGWQFLCGTTNRSEDGRVVGLGEMFKDDPSIGEVADLPEGWQAERKDANSPWVRRRKADEP